LDDNIKIDNTEMGFKIVDWVCGIQNRDQYRTVVNTVTNVSILIVWVVTTCGLAGTSQRFREIYLVLKDGSLVGCCLHHRPDDGGSR
jgi:hypothetical protein